MFNVIGSSLLVSLLSVVGPAFAKAAPLNFKITGMHCGACESNVEKTVCKDAGYAKCKATVVDASKQAGELVIETKPGQKADPSEIVKKLEKLGYKTELKATPSAKGS